MPAFEAIASASPSSTGTVTFSSIPGTYEHLQLRMYARNTDTAGSRSFLVEPNSDTGANYAYHVFTGNGSAPSISSSANDTFAVLGTMPANSAAANVFGVAVIDLLDYASTNKNKTFRSLSGFDNNGSGNAEFGSFLWKNTAAVTSLRIYFASGNFTSGSVIALYGLRSA